MRYPATSVPIRVSSAMRHGCSTSTAQGTAASSVVSGAEGKPVKAGMSANWSNEYATHLGVRHV
jgi:hypothetical protein